MTEAPRILVAEDDPRLLSMLEQLLTREGYRVQAVRDGQRALHLGLTEQFDSFLFDRGLPVVEGLDLLTKLRRAGVQTPALILSARGNPSDRVEGLDRGAEDYLAKPFDVDELLARLRVLRRRVSMTIPVLLIPGGVFDTHSRSVAIHGREPCSLSEREADLLERLARRPEQIFSRDDLLSAVFADADTPGIVDTYVHHLRRKLGRSVISTIRGVGYQIGRRG